MGAGHSHNHTHGHGHSHAPADFGRAFAIGVVLNSAFVLVEAGAQRYFNHSAARLSQNEAARMAAALPLPKERPVLNPTGFTRRYGNTIQARIGVVRRDGLDACIYG